MRPASNPQPAGAAAAKPHAIVIVVHGMGLHPDRDLEHALRTELPQAGYATLWAENAGP